MKRLLLILLAVSLNLAVSAQSPGSGFAIDCNVSTDYASILDQSSAQLTTALTLGGMDQGGIVGAPIVGGMSSSARTDGVLAKPDIACAAVQMAHCPLCLGRRQAGRKPFPPRKWLSIPGRTSPEPTTEPD